MAGVARYVRWNASLIALALAAGSSVPPLVRLIDCLVSKCRLDRGFGSYFRKRHSQFLYHIRS